MGNSMDTEKDGTVVSLFRKWHSVRTKPNGIDFNTFTIMLLSHLAFEYVHTDGKRYLVVNLEEIRTVCPMADEICNYVSENNLGRWLIYEANKTIKRTETKRFQDLLRNTARGLLAIGTPSTATGYTLLMETYDAVSEQENKNAGKRIAMATNDPNIEKYRKELEIREEDYKNFCDGNGSLSKYSTAMRMLNDYEAKVCRGKKLTKDEFHNLLNITKCFEYNYLFTVPRKTSAITKEYGYCTEVLNKLTATESFYIPLYFIMKYIPNNDKRTIPPTIYQLYFNIDDVIMSSRGKAIQPKNKGFGKANMNKNKSFDNDRL